MRTFCLSFSVPPSSAAVPASNLQCLHGHCFVRTSKALARWRLSRLYAGWGLVEWCALWKGVWADWFTLKRWGEGRRGAGFSNGQWTTRTTDCGWCSRTPQQRSWLRLCSKLLICGQLSLEIFELGFWSSSDELNIRAWSPSRQQTYILLRRIVLTSATVNHVRHFWNSLDTVWIQLAENDTYRADVKELYKILTPLWHWAQHSIPPASPGPIRIQGLHSSSHEAAPPLVPYPIRAPG